MCSSTFFFLKAQNHCIIFLSIGRVFQHVVQIIYRKMSLFPVPQSKGSDSSPLNEWTPFFLL